MHNRIQQGAQFGCWLLRSVDCAWQHRQ